MRMHGFMGLAAVVVLALPLNAQLEGNPRVMRVFAGGRYQGALCPLKGDFRTSSAGVYLKTSVEGSEGGKRPDDEKRLGIIKKGKDAALGALQANPKSPAGWYYLGRAELLLGNLTGADTAFTKAAELAPDCAEEVKGYRQRAWQPLLSGGTEFLRAERYDSALALFREAAAISRDYPQGFYNTGVLFATTNQHDSSAFYFKLAVEKAGSDPRFAKDKLNAIINLASMYQALNRHAEAVVEFRTYLAAEPNDIQAKRAMASSLRLSGQAEEAGKIESAMLASAIADGTVTASELMVIGVGLFQDKKYAEAGEAFSKALEKEPFNRDARFNLANVYLAQKNGPKLIETGHALLAMEPLNAINAKLVAEGHRAANEQDKLLAEVVKVMAMPTTMTVDYFRVRNEGAKVTATATGLDATTADGKSLPAAARTINFEFIDATGAVVASKEVAIPALAAGETHAIEIELKGAGITGWRYTVK